MDTTFQHAAPKTTNSALGFAERALSDKESAMHVHFVSRPAAPERLVCEAELVFDDNGPLAGLRLVGLALWRGANSDTYVTFPSRAFGAGETRRFFDYLRGDAEAVKRFKAFVLEAFHALEARGGQPEVPADAHQAAPSRSDAGRNGRKRPQ